MGMRSRFAETPKETGRCSIYGRQILESTFRRRSQLLGSIRSPCGSYICSRISNEAIRQDPLASTVTASYIPLIIRKKANLSRLLRILGLACRASDICCFPLLFLTTLSSSSYSWPRFQRAPSPLAGRPSYRVFCSGGIIRVDKLPSQRSQPLRSRVWEYASSLYRHLSRMAISDDLPSPRNQTLDAGDAYGDAWMEAENHDWPAQLISSIEHGKCINLRHRALYS